MLATRCVRTATACGKFSQVTGSRVSLPSNLYQRSFSVLSRTSVRPSIQITRLESVEAPTTIQPAVSTGFSHLQIREWSTPTYNPSHRVRKRRHGFLSRIRTRNGRAIITRRKVKGKKNFSH